MTDEHVSVEPLAPQYRITLDRPGKPNPIAGQTIEELHDAIDGFESSEACVLVVTGSDGVFATGADISYLEEWIVGEDWESMLTFVREGQLLMNRLASLPAPTIAAIDGYALGGGLELALACDLRFASENATLGFPEVDLGMLPGWGGTQRLPRLVGQSTATDLLITGRHVGVREAEAIGLVDRVFDGDDLLDGVADYAETLAEKPPETLRYVLEAARVATENPLETGLSYELMNDMLSAFTDDARERTRAFLDR